MHDAAVWIDIERHADGRKETLCTLFGRHTFSTRPVVGESLTFHPSKESTVEFKTVYSALGPRSTSLVNVRLEEVDHSAVNADGRITWETTFRCSPIVVPTVEDARKVCAFMTEQLGFEFDPYGVNILSE